jgi:hypothetical protein
MTTTAQPYRARIGAWVKARLLRNPHALRIDCEGWTCSFVQAC